MTMQAISNTIASDHMTNALTAILNSFHKTYGRGPNEAERRFIARNIVLNLMAAPLTEAALEARTAKGQINTTKDQQTIQAEIVEWLERLAA